MRASIFVVLALFIGASLQADRPFFAPYGPANGDATLHRNDDEFTDAVLLIGGMNFFNSTRTYLYVDNNGIITLDAQLSDYTPSSLATLGIPAIAPYWADVDTRPANGGFVYYRSTLDPTLAASVSSFVRATNPGSNFIGTRTFVASWIDVGYYNQKTNKLCTFQCILIADDLGQTYAIFNYGDMQWTTGDASGGSNGLGGVPAAVGFTKGDSGVYAQVAESLTPAIINIYQGSNCAINGVPQIGQYIYSVSAGASVASCCSSSNPPVLTGTPSQLNFTIVNFNTTIPPVGTVTATYECTSPVQEVIDPVLFVVYGCPITRTWTATDDCFKTSSVQQTFTYPEVFSEPLQLTTPPDYTFSGSCNNPTAPDPSVSGQGSSNRGSNGQVTYQDSVWVSNGFGSCTMTRYWQAQDICNVFQRGEQVITILVELTTQAPPAPLTTGRLTTQELTTQPLTTQELTTQPLTTQELTTDFFTVADRCATYSWPETQGWFCSADQTGYYQCLKGPWASQAKYQPCPPTTYCRCPVGVECSPYGICTF